MAQFRTNGGRREVWVADPTMGWPYGRWVGVGRCGWSTLVTSLGAERRWSHAVDCRGGCQPDEATR